MMGAERVGDILPVLPGLYYQLWCHGLLADLCAPLYERTGLKRLGAKVGSKLNTLAAYAVASDIKRDLGHRSPSGNRQVVILKRRGADAIKEAVERDRESLSPLRVC